MNPLDDPKSRILAFDFGTGGLTIGLYNMAENAMEAFGEADYKELDPPAGTTHHEQDPRDWIAAIPVAMEQIREQAPFDPEQIAAIGIGGHMHALVVLDDKNQPVLRDGRLLSGAIMWNDPRGEEQGAALSAELNEPIAARMTASRVRWLAGQEPQAWRELVHRVAVPSTYVALELTGSFGVGAGEASGMFGQLNAQGQLDRDKLATIDPLLPGRAPRVGAAGEMLGRLNERGAELLGLPTGAPVAFPEGDQPVGMVASACVEPGQASISLGNSVVFNAVGSRPILDCRGVIDSFRTATGDHLLMTCATSGTIVMDELVACFSEWEAADGASGDTAAAAAIRQRLTALAERVPAGCGGVVALPFYQGEGVFRQPHAFASVLGFRRRDDEGRRSGVLSPGVLTRASLEANSLILRHGYDQMQLGGLDQLVASGGGSQNRLWLQILADVFGVPVRLPQDAHEAATRGAAYLALFMLAKQAGRSGSLAELLAQRVTLSRPVKPNGENAAVYRDQLAALRRAVDQLAPLYEGD